MRTIWMGVGIGLGMAAGSAAYANALGHQGIGEYPEARAYIGFGFDKPREMARPLRYGLRIDHDQRYLVDPLPAIAQFEFDSSGFSWAAVNGLPMVQRSYQLDQFGKEVGEVRYSWADWGLLAVGVVGLGFLIAEIADSDSDRDPERTEDSGDGDGDGPDRPICNILPLPILCLQQSLSAGYALNEMNMEQKQRLQWLDAGTGFMGDLEPR